MTNTMEYRPSSRADADCSGVDRPLLMPYQSFLLAILAPSAIAASFM